MFQPHAWRPPSQPQPRNHTHCLHLPPPPHPTPDWTMACYLPTGQEIGHALAPRMRGYYCFCVCTIVKSSLRATNNGNFLQSSGGRTGPWAAGHGLWVAGRYVLSFYRSWSGTEGIVVRVGVGSSTVLTVNQFKNTA